MVVGAVIPAAEVGGARYVEGPLEGPAERPLEDRA